MPCRSGGLSSIPGSYEKTDMTPQRCLLAHVCAHIHPHTLRSRLWNQKQRRVTTGWEAEEKAKRDKTTLLMSFIYQHMGPEASRHEHTDRQKHTLKLTCNPYGSRHTGLQTDTHRRADKSPLQPTGHIYTDLHKSGILPEIVKRLYHSFPRHQRSAIFFFVILAHAWIFISIDWLLQPCIHTHTHTHNEIMR